MSARNVSYYQCLSVVKPPDWRHWRALQWLTDDVTQLELVSPVGAWDVITWLRTVAGWLDQGTEISNLSPVSQSVVSGQWSVVSGHRWRLHSDRRQRLRDVLANSKLTDTAG